MSRLVGCAFAFAWVVAGCGPGAAPVVQPAEPVVAPAPALAPDEAQTRRQAWLREVEGYLADPATLPRLADPAGRARFEALVSEPAWRELDVETLAREGAALVAVYPAAKALAVSLAGVGAADEVVLLALFIDDVNRAFLAAGRALLAAQPAGTSQVNREQGLEELRIGAAINLSALLDFLSTASAPIVGRVMERLEDRASYAMLSSGSMQLFLATLDERMTRAPRPIRAQLVSIRAVAVAAQHQAAWPPSDRVFEPMALWPTFTTRAVASKRGGFTVDVGTPPLVWRRESPAAGGGTQVWHELEWRDGALLFEVACFDHVKEEQLADSFLASGGTERVGPGPGRWFGGGTAELDVRGRLLTIGARVCVAGVQAPRGQVDGDRFDAVLGSLRPTP